MSEQLIIELRYAIKYFELTAAFIGMLHWKKWSTDVLKYLIIYLIIISASEFLGNWFGRMGLHTEKYFLYKWFVFPFEFFFLTFFFSKVLKIRNHRIIFIILVFVYVSCFTFEKIFLDNVKLPLNSLSYSVSVVIILFYIFQYLKNLTQSNKILDFYKLPVFWVVSSFFLFYLISFPYYLLFNSLVKHYYKEIFLPYQLIVIILNYIMYTIFIVNFIWTKPK